MADIEEMKALATKKATQKLLDLQAVEGTPEIQVLQTKEANRRALTSRNASHKATMQDFTTGQALDRALEGYKVKKAVADVAKADGRTVAGSTIVVPAPAPEIEGEQPNA